MTPSNQSWRKVKLGIHNIITTQYGLTDDFGFDVDSMVKAIIEEEIKPLLAQQKRELCVWFEKELNEILGDIQVIQSKYKTATINNLANMIHEGYGVDDHKAEWEKQ